MGEIFAVFLAAFLTPTAPLGNVDIAAELPAQIFSIAAPAPNLPKNFQPAITAPEALIADVASGSVIWTENAQEKRPIASLTKLMTALIIVENHRLDEVVTVPAEAASVEGSTMNLFAGEQLTVQSLLYGLLIPSANDAAVTLAIFHSGSETAFVQQMNERAALLGMTMTHFVNEHGLDAPEHYSTAFDLALLARKVLEFSILRKITTTIETSVSSVDGKFQHALKTTNDLLKSPYPVFGLKTGTTDEAGQCLITLLKSPGHELLVVVLGSSDRFQDSTALFRPFL